jgi:hypothetical protein
VIGLDDQLREAITAHSARQAIEREQYEKATGQPWPSDYVFTTSVGTPYNRGILRRRLRQLFTRAGIEGTGIPPTFAAPTPTWRQRLVGLRLRSPPISGTHPVPG